MRLGKVLEGHEGLEAANATLMGQVTLAYDDELTSREALLKAMARGGFRELPARLSGECASPEGRLNALLGWPVGEREHTDSRGHPPPRAACA